MRKAPASPFIVVAQNPVSLAVTNLKMDRIRAEYSRFKLSHWDATLSAVQLSCWMASAGGESLQPVTHLHPVMLHRCGHAEVMTPARFAAHRGRGRGWVELESVCAGCRVAIDQAGFWSGYGLNVSDPGLREFLKLRDGDDFDLTDTPKLEVQCGEIAARQISAGWPVWKASASAVVEYAAYKAREQFIIELTAFRRAVEKGSFGIATEQELGFILISACEALLSEQTDVWWWIGNSMLDVEKGAITVKGNYTHWIAPDGERQHWLIQKRVGVSAIGYMKAHLVRTYKIDLRLPPGGYVWAELESYPLARFVGTVAAHRFHWRTRVYPYQSCYFPEIEAHLLADEAEQIRTNPNWIWWCLERPSLELI